MSPPGQSGRSSQETLLGWTETTALNRPATTMTSTVLLPEKPEKGGAPLRFDDRINGRASERGQGRNWDRRARYLPLLPVGPIK